MFTRATALTSLELKTAIVQNPLVVSPDTIVIDAIVQMSGVRSRDNALRTADGQSDDLQEVRSSCVVVVEDDRVVGILTERDVVRLSAQQQPLDRLVMRQVMTHPVVTLHESASTDLFFALDLLQHNHIHHLPILDQQDRLVGLVTHESLLPVLNSLGLKSHAFELEQQAAAQITDFKTKTEREKLLALAAQLQEELAERQRAEALSQHQLVELTKWRDRYELAGQASGQVLYEYDFIRDFITWGANTEKILGYPSSALPTHLAGWRALVYPDDQAILDLSAKQALAGKTPFFAQYQVQHQLGHHIWVEDRSQWLINDQGETMGVVGMMADISDRKQAETRLRESEQRCATLAAAAPVGIFRTDAAGNCSYVNDRWFQITGLTLEASAGEGWQQALHPDDHSGVVAEWSQSTKENRPFQLEYRFQRPDGKVTWVYGQSVAERDGVETVIGYVGTVTDISDRKRSEEALQKSEAHQRALISAIPDLIMRINRAGIYLEFVTTSNFHVVGNLLEMVGTHVFDSLPLELAQKRLKFVQLALQTNSVQIYEQDLSIDGRTQIEEVRVVPYSDDEVMILVRDISDRKQAEFALKQSEATSKAVLAAIPDLMFRVGADGDHRGYVTPNRGFGVLSQEIDSPGRSMPDRLPAVLADRQLHYLQKALQTGELQVYEQQVQVGDRLQDEEVRVVKSGDDEVLFMTRDISDRKQAETALRCLIESTASVTGKDFFSTLAQQLMLALKVQYVLVTKLVGDRLQTLAHWKDGEPQPEVTFALADTPCGANAIEQGQFYCPKGLQQRFFEYPLIQSTQADSYLGIAITSTNGQPLGCLCILDNKPIGDIQWAEAFLRIFATRAAAELERQQATEALEQLNQELEDRVEQRTAALRNSEATLSAIFNQAAVGMNLATLDGQYVKVNQKLCDILGYTQEELLTKNFKDLFHLEDIDKGQAERQQLHAGAIDSFSVEMRYLHKDGNAVWLSVTVSLVCESSIEPNYSIGVVKEIGDRKRAEEALRQSEEKFRQIAEHIQSVFWMSNIDCSEIIYVSPAYETILGRSCDSLYASPQSFTDAIHPQDQTRILALLTDRPEGYDEEYRILQPDGALRWLRDRAFPIHNAQGEVYRIAGIAEDITDRKQAEETLNRQLALIEASIDGIIMLNTNGKCTYLNEAQVKLFGYDSAEELLGKPWQTLCSPSEMRRFEQDIFPVLIETRAWRGEVRAIRRDGSTFDNEVSFTLTSTGEVICVCRDISDRRQAEQALQQSEEQFRTFFDSAPIAISLAKVDTYQILRVNAAQRQLLGYTNGELATMSFADFTHPDDIDQDIKQVKEMVRGEIPGFCMEKRFVKKNGDVILTNMTAALIRDQEGYPLYSMAMIEDITDRRQAELEIIRNRDLREAIFNESTDAIFLVNIEPSITLDCNRRAVELFEASDKDELLQIEGHILQRHQFTEEELKLISQEIKDKGFWSCEVEYVTRKGNPFWGNLAAKQISIAGQVMNLVQVTDISKRKQSELLLKAQQEFLRRLIDTVPNLIFVKDWEGRFTLVNQSTANVYGSTIADLVHKTDADFSLNMKEVEQFLAVDRDVMTTMTTKVSEETVTSPNGKQFYFQIIKTPIMSVDGHSREILGVATDISDRRQIEEQLRRSEAYLLEAQRIAHVGSWEFDLATQRITWSAETFRMFGRDPAQQEPTYEELLQYIHPDDRDHHTAVLQPTIEQVQPFELEHRVLQTDGSISYVLTKGQPILDETGKLLSFLGTVLDITNRKQFEEQLRQTNEQLAHTTRLKDEFLANMSHELRTPLNSILGMTEGLQDQVFGAINEPQSKALQTIERSGSHLLELINDILDIAKIESGQLELDCAPTAVISLCQSSLAFIRQQALKKHIQLEIKLPPHLPDLSVDGRRIRQVLINLVNNAVKFTPDGGRITLKVSYQQIPSTPESNDSSPQNFLRIAVIDTGIGIAPDHINRLFQPFIQIDSALNRQYQGTGLGLALVKRIVELHGGQVGLTSEVGVGSCFTIDLPCAALPSTSELETQLEPGIASSQLAKASPLILLAEDNEANIVTVSGYLRAKGYQVLLAKNGQEAVALAQSETPDLILMDIQMPGMDGLEAVQQIRCEPTLVDVPIIALTALAMIGDRERCLAAGANDYLSKPIQLRQLVTTIQQLLVS